MAGGGLGGGLGGRIGGVLGGALGGWFGGVLGGKRGGEKGGAGGPAGCRLHGLLVTPSPSVICFQCDVVEEDSMLVSAWYVYSHPKSGCLYGFESMTTRGRAADAKRGAFALSSV